MSKGDALFGMADVASARLFYERVFYERAADVGKGEAAVRLDETTIRILSTRLTRQGLRGILAVAPGGIDAPATSGRVR